MNGCKIPLPSKPFLPNLLIEHLLLDARKHNDNHDFTMVTARLLRQKHMLVGLVEETESHVALLGGCLLLGLLLLSLGGSGSSWISRE